MKFPHDEKELDALFKTGKKPDTNDFVGQDYFVDLLTGLPSARALNHRKLFFKTGDLLHGHNQILGFVDFGYFKMEEAVDEETNMPVLVLDYDQPKTSFLFDRMIDHIVELEKDMYYLGRYYIRNHGKLELKGYFSLVNCKRSIFK
jgi:hypothetical protein